MGIDKINIAYAGTLAGVEEAQLKNKKKSFLNGLKSLFWTYSNNSVDFSTRTGYYLIKAVAELKKKKITSEHLQINLWGNISEINVRQIKENGVEEYFKIEGYLSKEESLQRLNQADLLFLPQEISVTRAHRTLFIPGKLYEYLNARKPILALADSSDCYEIIKKSGLGILCSPNDSSEIAEIIFGLFEDTSWKDINNINEELIQSYDFKNKAKQIAEIFNEVLKK